MVSTNQSIKTLKYHKTVIILVIWIKGICFIWQCKNDSFSKTFEYGVHVNRQYNTEWVNSIIATNQTAQYQSDVQFSNGTQILCC